MDQDTLIIIGILILDIPLFVYLGKIWFGGWNSFIGEFKWNFIPDLASLLSGRYLKDKKAEQNSQLFGVVCLMIVLFELTILSEIL